MKKRKLKKSTTIPLLLLVYLAFMAFIGFDYFRAGNYLMYFGTIGVTLVVIIILHFALKRSERLRKEREEDIKNS